MPNQPLAPVIVGELEPELGRHPGQFHPGQPGSDLVAAPHLESTRGFLARGGAIPVDQPARLPTRGTVIGPKDGHRAIYGQISTTARIAAA